MLSRFTMMFETSKFLFERKVPGQPLALTECLAFRFTRACEAKISTQSRYNLLVIEIKLSLRK